MSSIGIHGGASGDVDVTTFPDNEPFNVAQWGGTNTTLGQKAMSASVPVTLASDQSRVHIGDSGGTVATSTFPGAGGTSSRGLVTRSFLTDGTNNGVFPSTFPVANSSALVVRSPRDEITTTTITTTTPGSAAITTYNSATTIASITGTWTGILQFIGTVDGGVTFFPIYGLNLTTGTTRESSTTTNGKWIFQSAGMIILGIVGPTSTGSATVILNASLGSSALLAESLLSQLLDKKTAGTATTTGVTDNAASVTLLAANGARKGAIIANDSSAALYVKFGTTATTTDYTVRIAQNGYFEVPFGYTGRIDGIWATDPNDGGARITELT